ncbi:MAG: hypothetical protein ABI181_02360 [Mycobacteriaceae bacterium]
MIAPERRSRRDLVAAATIVVVAAVLVGVVWSRSDARATTSIPASSPLPALVPAAKLPTTVHQLWTAPSGATRAPVVVGGAVVTGDGHGVQGRDAATGTVRWIYSRDLNLCAVDGQWSLAVSVFDDGEGCSQVTALQGDTGARGPQRSSAADDAVTLTGDGTYLVSTGRTRLDVWRSDLVRTVQLGRVRTPVSPGVQPRAGCVLHAALSVPSRLSVLATCPKEKVDRLILLDPAPSDAAKPQEQGSVLLPSKGARLLAVGSAAEAVLVPEAPGGPEVVVYDGTGRLVTRYLVPVPEKQVAALAATALPEPVSAGPVLTVAVGRTLLALDPTTLALRWSAQDVLGSGVLLAGSFVVPTPQGLTPLDATTGRASSTVAVDRGGYAGPVQLGVAGSVVLEQRGRTLVALG